jgi:hypothetical protein
MPQVTKRENFFEPSSTKHLFPSFTANDGLATNGKTAAKSDQGLTSSRTSILMARRATSCSSLPRSSARDVSSSSATCQRRNRTAFSYPVPWLDSTTCCLIVLTAFAFQLSSELLSMHIAKQPSSLMVRVSLQIGHQFAVTKVHA